MIRGTVFVILLAALDAGAAERSFKGADLYNSCTSESPAQQNFCHLYIAAFVRGFQAGKDAKGILCLPENLTGAEAEEVFKRKMRDMKKRAADQDNPFMMGNADPALIAALGLQYKCAPGP